jgi:hypothetical protein
LGPGWTGAIRESFESSRGARIENILDRYSVLAGTSSDTEFHLPSGSRLYVGGYYYLAVERLEKSILSSQSSRHENMKLTSQDSSSKPPYIKTAFAREL